MGVVILKGNLTKKDVKIAREEYSSMIKITIDIEKEIIAIGGEYHFDAEQILVKEFDSKNSSIWGGGYYIETKTFSVNAMLNYKSNYDNPSGDILSEDRRNRFLKLAQRAFANIESLL